MTNYTEPDSEDSETMIFEDLYAGNASVMEKLLASMKSGGITAFTGAGTSMPAMPSWSQLVRDLVDGATTDGRLDTSTAEALRLETDDILYVIDEIYNAVGEAQTKAKVSKLFSSLEQPTAAHKLLVEIAFDRIMTLNYDVGLEMAYAERHSQHVNSILAEQTSEVDEWLRHNEPMCTAPILHWHGKAGDANSIILSGSDYVNFYEKSSANKETLRNIFRTRQVLMLGFGFADPFIERELNSIMQPLPKANSHFAIIGVNEESNTNIQLERRKYSSKYKLETIFYPICMTDGKPDHAALLDVLGKIAKAWPRVTSIAEENQPILKPMSNKEANVSHRSNLFVIGETAIYCEPNIWTSNKSGDLNSESRIGISEILSGNYNCNIIAPHEYGLSNLGKRIVSELVVTGKKAFFRDSNSVPKYRKGIQADVDFTNLATTEEFSVVLDNFSTIEHQRTVRELFSIYSNVRIFVLQKSNYNGAPDDSLEELNFKAFNLTGLSRPDIRSVVNVLAPDRNSDDTSAIVDKVYADLLQLCIPLTPSNVIMYASVLCKDGNFSPVSRLHIVDRFVSEALRRASDAYADTFNFLNKIDLICGFGFFLFSKNIPTFTEAEWASYCTSYKRECLVEFSSTEILGDLFNGRIVIKDGPYYLFRYRMFFSYFVGRYIADRPELLRTCLTENRHLELDGLIEVLCGMLPDCSLVLDDLTEKLSKSMESFYESYPIRGLDLHKDVKWPIENDEGKLWDAVSDRLERGPANSQELDELKTSIHAERRTEDQKVSIIKFIASEKSVTNNAWNLATALERFPLMLDRIRRM